jgi:hypothetical protein
VLDKFAEMPELIEPNFTIYVLSSSVDPGDKEKAANNKLVSGYLEKPLSRDKLKSMFQLV